MLSDAKAEIISTFPVILVAHAEPAHIVTGDAVCTICVICWHVVANYIVWGMS